MNQNAPNATNTPIDPVAKYTKRILTARSTLLLVALFTVVNTVLTIAQVDYYMLFSAYLPYFLVVMAMLFTGHMPSEWYEEWTDFEPLPDAVLYFAVIFAAVIVALYVLFFILSKKNPKWLYGALAFIVIDSLVLLLLFDTSIILDVAFHIWILVELVMAVSAIKKLAQMPQPADVASFDGDPVPFTGDPVASDSEQSEQSDPSLNASEGYKLNGEDENQ